MNRYSIKIVSEITSFPESTLRYYEKVGVLGYVSRNLNGLRRYEENIENNIEDIIQLVMSSENKLRVKIIAMQEQLRHVHKELQYYHGIKHAISNYEKWKKYEDYA